MKLVVVTPLSVLKPIASAQGEHGDLLTGGAPAHWLCLDRTTEARRPAPRHPRPNKRVQATANKLRSCLAPLVRRAWRVALIWLPMSRAG